jgi:putative thioredoxin
MLAAAGGLLATRHWGQAAAAYREALDHTPHSGQAALVLVKALLALGRGCEAADLMDGFPRADELIVAEKLRPLAEWLCTVEPADPPLDETEADALYSQSARLFARGQWEASLDGLLDVLRQDKRYRNGAPRQVILGVFELLGESDPLTQTYRSELASVLF